MKNKRHIKSFNEASENLNISDVMESKKSGVKIKYLSIFIYKENYMGKIIRLNENDLRKLVIKIIKESKQEEINEDLDSELLRGEYSNEKAISDFNYDELRFIKEFKDYKGYLTGSLVHLYKHKSELQNEINSLEIKIGSQSLMNSLLPSRNKASMIYELTKELSVLKKELSEVSDAIAKHNKSKY